MENTEQNKKKQYSKYLISKVREGGDSNVAGDYWMAEYVTNPSVKKPLVNSTKLTMKTV